MARKIGFNRKFGVLLLAGWLILSGLASFNSYAFAGWEEIRAVVAIAAGVLLVLDR